MLREENQLETTPIATAPNLVQLAALNKKEAEFSSKAGSTAVSFSRFSKTTPYDKDVLVMQLASGEELHQLTKNKKSASSAWWLELISNTCKGIKKLHDANILHRDIKPENFVANQVTCHVVPVDYGMACDVRPNGVVYESPRGSPGFMAPEVWRGAFSKKSDIYALGATIAEALGLGYITGATPQSAHLEFYASESNQYKENDRFPSREVQDATIGFCKSMMDPNPNKRPEIDTVIEYFNHAQLLCLDVLSKMKNIGVLDVQEYLNASPSNQEKMLKLLKIFDEVLLIDNAQKNSSQYTRLHKGLAQAGIAVTDTVIHYQDEKRSELLDQMKIQHANQLTNYFNISFDASKSQMPKVNPNDKNALKIMRAEIKTKHLLDQQVQTLVNMIDADCRRVKEKYPENIASERINILQRFLTDVQVKQKDGSLTFKSLNNDLKKVEKAINGTNAVTQFLSKFLPIKPTETHKILKQAKKEMSQQEKDYDKYTIKPRYQ